MRPGRAQACTPSTLRLPRKGCSRFPFARRGFMGRAGCMVVVGRDGGRLEQSVLLMSRKLGGGGKGASEMHPTYDGRWAHTVASGGSRGTTTTPALDLQ